MFLPSHTLLLITRQVLARIDLTGKRRLRVKQIWTHPSCDYDVLTPEINRTLKLGPRPGRLTVISPDYWTDVLSLPTDVVSIASLSETVQALALEAEVDSGLSAFESRTAAIPLASSNADDSQWCVTQVADAQLRELSQIAKFNKTQLLGAAHPVAAQLASIENANAEQAVELLQCWREQTEFTTEQVAELARAWSICLASTTRSPLMIGEIEGAATTQPIALTASLALLAFGGCGLWHWQVQQRLSSAKLAIEVLEKKQSQHDATDAALKSAEASIAQMRMDLSKTQAARQTTERQLELAAATHTQQNQRWVALVDALSQLADGSCWVQRLESTPVQTIVHGLAIDVASANRFAGRLESALQHSGWTTIPAKTLVTPNGLVTFDVVLEAKLKPNVPQTTTGISPVAANGNSMKDAVSISLTSMQFAERSSP